MGLFMNNDKRRALKAAFRNRETQALEASMPLSKEQLRGLFDYLDTKLETGCDHTTKNTLLYLHSLSLDSDRIMPWLQDLGGYCD